MYKLHLGSSPLIISIPHSGVKIPNELDSLMTPVAERLQDTDWYVDRLYEFAKALNATVVSAELSRYVVDLNRDPTGNSLYPGQFTTGLCPTTTFMNEPLYTDDSVVNEVEINRRVTEYWQPYHREIQNQLSRVKSEHGYALLFDAHSIASRVPALFDGQLPDLNYGTFNGKSCAVSISKLLECLNTHEFSSVLNGRFKGGYITRHYGNPGNNIHAVQLELSQATYMNEATGEWDEPKAQSIQAVLKQLCLALIDWKPATINTSS